MLLCLIFVSISIFLSLGSVLGGLGLSLSFNVATELARARSMGKVVAELFGAWLCYGSLLGRIARRSLGLGQYHCFGFCLGKLFLVVGPDELEGCLQLACILLFLKKKKNNNEKILKKSNG